MGRLYKRFGMEDEFRNSDFLEMASLGTVCDVMDLQKDNRAIVKAGMKKMQITNNVGMQALMEVLGLKDKILKSYDYGLRSDHVSMQKDVWIRLTKHLTF